MNNELSPEQIGVLETNKATNEIELARRLGEVDRYFHDNVSPKKAITHGLIHGAVTTAAFLATRDIQTAAFVEAGLTATDILFTTVMQKRRNQVVQSNTREPINILTNVNTELARAQEPSVAQQKAMERFSENQKTLGALLNDRKQASLIEAQTRQQEVQQQEELANAELRFDNAIKHASDRPGMGQFNAWYDVKSGEIIPRLKKGLRQVQGLSEPEATSHVLNRYIQLQAQLKESNRTDPGVNKIIDGLSSQVSALQGLDHQDTIQ